MTHFFRHTRSLCMAAVLLGIVTPAGAQSHPVRLRVQSKSWVRDSTFDAEGLNALCAQAGVELIPIAGRTVEATAVIEYVESKGPGFSMFGVGEPVGFGTNIAFKLTLLDGAAGKSRFTLRGSAETPGGLAKEDFHLGARQRFNESPAYRLSCAAIAASLGSREQALRLLPWALVDKQAVDLLTTVGFAPEGADQQAYLALGARDFTRLRSLNEAAVEPILVLLQNSRSARDGIGTFEATDPERARLLLRAMAALPQTDDDRVADTLATVLNDYDDYRTANDANVTSVLIEVIHLLARRGTVFSLPLLDTWQSGTGALAREATTAAALLRQRLELEAKRENPPAIGNRP